MFKIFQSRASRNKANKLRLLISQSGLFHAEHYRKQVLKLGPAPKDLIGHYLSQGYRLGLDPSPTFSNSGYARAFGLNGDKPPLIHHVERCIAALKRHPEFDLGYYVSTNPDVARSTFDPAWHFLIHGYKEARHPSPRGDGFALAREIGLYDAWGPLASRALPEAMDTSPAPSEEVEAVAAQECNEAQATPTTTLPPVLQAMEFEEVARLVLQSGLFDVKYYLICNQDVADSGSDPLEHFLKYGGFEGRDPNHLFQSAWYLNHYGDVYATGLNPLVHYLLVGAGVGNDPSPLFDTDWYLEHYTDVREAGLNPLSHFIVNGTVEGRFPKAPSEPVHLVGQKLFPYEAWLSVNKLSTLDKSELAQRLKDRDGRLPKISLITAVYNTDRTLLLEMVGSVLAQLYDNWELCLCDDGSTAGHIGSLLLEVAAMDDRIKVRRLPRNGGISVATNAAVELATGSVIAFLDHDDLLTPDCVAELACYYADHPQTDIVYSDDDKIAMDGRRYAPQFKPDWSPVLLLSFMYISHIFSVRRELFIQLGGFRSDFDGSQDYDFALRAAEAVKHVGHIPKILYHWRAAPGSTAASADTKPKSLEAGRKAVEEALRRRSHAGARAIHPAWADEARVGMFEVRFPDQGPRVCIVIPTKNQHDYLRTCVDSLKSTTYENYDILIIDNASDDPRTLSYLESLSTSGTAKVAKIPNRQGRFNYAAIHNEAVRLVDAEYLLFLNNDTEVIAPTWLSQMAGYAQMPGVGAVGARLYFDDRTIQHAGIVHGYHEGLVGHAFRNLPPHDWGYLGFVRTAREYSGVTAACMLTPRAVFNELGGFDEENFAVAYNDVDYCYRIVDSGRTCVYCSTAELFHFEGKTRGYKDNPRERANFRRSYGKRVDPWYNRNLSLENEDFRVAPIHAETTRSLPLRIAAVSHNLNHEGAPTTLLDLVIGLQEQGHVTAVVLSPSDGPLRSLYEAQGIRVVVLDKLLHGVEDESGFNVGLTGLGMLFKALDAEVVVANTLQTFWAIAGATRAGIPSLWCQHESEPWQTYFDYLPEYMRPQAYASFAKAYRVLYVAEATRRSWIALETRGNFKIIRHGIPLPRLAEEVGRWTQASSREQLGLSAADFVFSVVGTVCRRKGQLDIVKAFSLLPLSVQQRIRVQLVGKVGESDYGDFLASQIARLDESARSHVVITGGVEDVFLYYASSDVFVCTSLVESAPRVLVEAMACSLPIITTPVFGIPELVQPDVNALFYEPGDDRKLAQLMTQMVEDDKLRGSLAFNSRPVLDGQPGFADMVDGYARVLREATNVEVASP